MQPLASLRRTMTWLCIYPDESSSKWQKRAYVAHTLIFLFTIVLCCIAEMTYYLKYFSTDFIGATTAFMYFICVGGAIYFLIVAILLRHQIKGIFTSLSTIYKSNENEMATVYLARANNTSDQLCKFYWKYVAVSVSGFTTTSLLSVLYSYTRGYWNVEHFYRPLPLVLPWNQTTLIGFAGEQSLDILAVYEYMLLNGIPLLFFISLCLHHRAFYEVFKQKTRKKIDVPLGCDLIRFHILAKDLFLDSVNVYSPFVWIQLTYNTMLMIVSVFIFDLQWHHPDFAMASAVIPATMGTPILFLYCYFGEFATKSYEMMSDCVYNDTKWYEEQPNKLRSHLISMIANMQKPIYYHGFNIVNLDLRTFLKICKSILSYYMAIKTLASK